MTEQTQLKKASKAREEYSKFKPFADDLRKAESWCELDGVLNRYQTVKNLSKMGYRKQIAGEWVAKDNFNGRCSIATCSNCGTEKALSALATIETVTKAFPYCEKCGARMKGEQ